MRKAALGALVSIGVHGAAIAWVRMPAVKPRPVKAIAPPAQADPEPIAIALLDDHTVPLGSVTREPRGTPGTRSMSQGGPATGAPRRGAISTGGPHTGGNETRPARPGAPSHSDLMTMRKPELKGLSQKFWDDFERNTKPLAPRDIASEQHGVDLANDLAMLNNPGWVENASPDEVRVMREKIVADQEARANQVLKPSGGGSYHSDPHLHDMLGNERPTYTMDTAPDGTATLHDGPNLKVHGLGGSFDVTDWAMRGNGFDPYAAGKLRMLDQTRDERVAIGKRYRKDQLAHAPAYVERNVARAWQLPDVHARKRALFDLWDECAESDDAASAGETARSLLVGFIRSKLPPDSADAYTPTELAMLNAHRQSKATFAPYD